jgi:hypothetical protein
MKYLFGGLRGFRVFPIVIDVCSIVPFKFFPYDTLCSFNPFLIPALFQEIFELMRWVKNYYQEINKTATVKKKFNVPIAIR